MRFRDKNPEQISADALRMAERKQAEGCEPCAESYRQVARRSLLRAGGLAVAGLAVSMADVSAIAGAAPGRARVDAEAVDPHQLSAHVSGNADVQRLRLLVGASTPTAAFRGTKGDWSLLIEQTAAGHVLSVLQAGGQVHAGAVIGETIFAVEGGRVVVSNEATRRYRLSKQHGQVQATLAGLVQPLAAEAACSICPGLLGSCALAVAACGRGCAACCTAAVAVCALALNCCFNQ